MLTTVNVDYCRVWFFHETISSANCLSHRKGFRITFLFEIKSNCNDVWQSLKERSEKEEKKKLWKFHLKKWRRIAKRWNGFKCVLCSHLSLPLHPFFLFHFTFLLQWVNKNLAAQCVGYEQERKEYKFSNLLQFHSRCSQLFSRQGIIMLFVTSDKQLLTFNIFDNILYLMKQLLWNK